MRTAKDDTSELISSVLSRLAGIISLSYAAILFASIVFQVFNFGVGPHLIPAAIMCILMFSVAAVTVPSIRARLENRRGFYKFGRVRTVDRKVTDDEQFVCISCGCESTTGVIRRYRDEFVVAGIPIVENGTGHNRYCADCVMGGHDQERAGETDRERSHASES